MGCAITIRFIGNPFAEFIQSRILDQTTTTMNLHQYTLFTIGIIKPGKEILSNLNPDQAHMIHMLLGLAGELGEVKSHLDNKPIWDKEGITLELGDLLFYLSSIFYAIDPASHYSMNGILKNCLASRRSPQDEGARIDEYFGNLMQSSLDMIDALKKSIIYGKDIVDIIVYPKRIYNYYIKLVYSLGISLDNIIEQNVAKLSERYPSGKYTDGDALNRKDT